MKLLNKEKAYIPKSKIKDYLLSDTHPVGRVKSKLFKKMGFNKENIELFERSILKIAHENEITQNKVSSYGEKYIIDGTVCTPVGKTIALRTVWIIEHTDERPRFVTAYPQNKEFIS